MNITVSNLYRYPIKGLSPQPLESVDLVDSFGFPGDRVFAVALPNNRFEEAQPEPKRKSEFLILAKYPTLAKIDASFDHETRTLSLTYEGKTLSEKADTPEGKERISQFLSPFYPRSNDAEGQVRLVAGNNEHRFTDVGTHSRGMMHSISLMNLNSIRALEKIAGCEIDVRRFRANIVVDGLPAWAEQDLVGKDFSLGEVRFQGVWPTSRCPATQANPDTGIRDINIPKLLKTNFGHSNLGVYISTQSAGRVSLGDRCIIPIADDFSPHAMYTAKVPSASLSTSNNGEDDVIVSDLGVSHANSKIIGQYKGAAEFLRQASKHVNDPEFVAKLLINELFGRLNKEKKEIASSPVSADNFGLLSHKVEANDLTTMQFKQALDQLWDADAELERVVRDLTQDSDISASDIDLIIRQIFEDHPDNVEKYKSGKTGLLGWFVGQAMKRSKGKGDAKIFNQRFTSLLNE